MRARIIAMNEDLMLARVLLGGYTDHDKHGLPCKKYLTDETEARHAIARLLRNQEPLDHDLREKLAWLFDPGMHPAIDHRKIVFAHRTTGPRENFGRNTAIAWHVWSAVTQGSSVNAAILSTADRFEMDESTVKKLWGKLRPIFEATWGKHRRPRIKAEKDHYYL
jgi:hypothetical protein